MSVNLHGISRGSARRTNQSPVHQLPLARDMTFESSGEVGTPDAEVVMGQG